MLVSYHYRFKHHINIYLLYWTTIPSLYLITAYASLYTYPSRDYQWLCLPTCQDQSLHISSIRNNDVASVCIVTHCQPISVIKTHGISSSFDMTRCSQALQLPFTVDNDSSNQNTMEFTAVVKLSNFHYDLHGDNRSSLAWAKSDRVNSLLARRANIIFTTISMHLNANLAKAEHVPGVLNTVFDGLYCNVSPHDLGLDPLLMYHATADDAMLQLVQLCNPSDQLSDMMSHTALLQQCTNLLLL